MDWIEVIGSMLPALAPGVAIGGIALSGIIVALVQLCRDWFKLPTKYAPWAAFVLAGVAYVVIQLIEKDLISTGVVEGGLTVLVVFLTVTGFYDRIRGTASGVVARWRQRGETGI